MIALTRAMVESGERLAWDSAVVMDKHSVGGLPGNRTTPIVVAIVAAARAHHAEDVVARDHFAGRDRRHHGNAGAGRSRHAAMRRVVEQEGGCIVWGGAVRLSPADDILIRVERALDLDSEGQMVASVLSKKIAAGSTHLVLDLPVGPTAKVRSEPAATALSKALIADADDFGLRATVVMGDGTQPIGRGIGPALEARDVLAVLQCAPDAPQDLRQRAFTLAGALIELAGMAPAGLGEAKAAQALDDGRAWAKFQRICEAQGGMRVPPSSQHRRADRLQSGRDRVEVIDNRRIAKLAKLAGAPEDKAAGVELHVRLGDRSSPASRCAPSTRRHRASSPTRSTTRPRTRYFRGDRVMTTPLLVAMPGNERLTDGSRRHASLRCRAHLEIRAFPDGETYLRFARTPTAGRSRSSAPFSPQ